MQGTSQLDAPKPLGHTNHRGDETLHVGSAASVQRITDLGHGVGIGRPTLPGRYHVGVARQHQPAACAGPERSHEVGTTLPGLQHRCPATVGFHVIGDPADELDVRRAALGRKADKVLQQVADLPARIVGDCGAWHDLTV